MTEAHTDTVRRREPPAAFDLKKRLDELARGECSADEFIRETLRGANGSSGAWGVLSYIDQRYRLGHLSDDLFHSIKSRISLDALQDREFGTTVELLPIDKQEPRSGARVGLPERAITPAPVIEGPAIPGRLLNNRYLLESALGSGGMGTVFKALDRCAPLPAQATRRVALKVLHDRAGERAAVQVQLRREFYCTQMLSHPNIVRVFELDRDGDLAFYTMELLDGEPLHQLIARTRPAGLPRPYAWALIRSVGAALVHAHSRNVIHGDLKPQNVMVTKNGEVRVLDFGSSRTSSDDAGDEGGLLTATPPYASCDVLEGAHPDACDDLYSLACLTYELLTGRHPFQSTNALRARSASERPARPAGLSAQSWQALRAALSWSRAERSVPVGEWLTRLGVDIGPQRLPAFSPTPLRWHERLRAFPWRDFAAPLVAAAIALILWPTLFRGRPPTPAMLETTAGAPADTAQPVASAAAPPAIPASTAQPIGSQSPARTAPPPRVLSAAASQAPVLAPPPAARSAAAPALPTRPAQPLPRAAGKPSITLTVRHRQIDRRANFVEVRVRGNETAREFSWWTEDGSAHAGVDYVAQARTQRPFTRQRRTATLFVRLLPAAGNRGTSIFYVNIAGPEGTSTGIARTAIELRGTSSR